MRYIYPAIFKQNELGGYSVCFPDFNCCVTDGNNLEDAVYMASEALEFAIEAEIELGHKLPDVSFDLEKDMGQLIVCVSVEADA